MKMILAIAVCSMVCVANAAAQQAASEQKDD